VRVSVQNESAGAEPVEEEAPGERLKSALVLAAFLIISAAVVAFGNIVTREAITGWYATAEKSPLALPPWATSTMWVVVHILVSVAAWLVWRERKRRRVTGALSLYVTQLVLNAMWRPVLLALYPRIGETAIWLAAVIMTLLIITVITMIREFWYIHRGAAIALFPYLLWGIYALSNNIFLGVLN
jgi:benzodiazapine receptor